MQRRIAMTSSAIMAAATDVLSKNGYVQARIEPSQWDAETARLFEDAYNVVGVVVFETVGELLRSWADMQGALVSVMSSRVGIHESKAWDGYLVLLTPSQSESDASEVEAIRYDTTRVRKLVGTGKDIGGPADVHRILSGLLPLPTAAIVADEGSALDALPELLNGRDIPVSATRTIVSAFREHQAMLVSLHRRGSE